MSAVQPIEDSFPSVAAATTARAYNIVDIPFEGKLKRNDSRADREERFIFYRLLAEDDPAVLANNPQELNQPLHGIFFLTNFNQRYSKETGKTETVRKEIAIFLSLKAENIRHEFAGVYQGMNGDNNFVCFEDIEEISCKAPPAHFAHGIHFGITSEKADGPMVSVLDVISIEDGFLDSAWGGKAEAWVDKIYRKTEINHAAHPSFGLFGFHELFGAEFRPRRPIEARTESLHAVQPAAR